MLAAAFPALECLLQPHLQCTDLPTGRSDSSPHTPPDLQSAFWCWAERLNC